MKTFKERLEELKSKASKKGQTFGTPYNNYEKSIVASNL